MPPRLPRLLLATRPIRPRLQLPIRQHSLRSNSSTTPSVPPPPPPKTSRLRSLSKEYGYSALGVYLALSALDFPFCFLAVRMLGTDRIGEWEDVVVGWFKRTVAPSYENIREAVGFPVVRPAGGDGGDSVAELDRWDDIDSAEREAEKSASIWTELALAYAIHKSFIFIRVPLTAAVTPKVVKILRGWGWDIGRKGKPKISMPGKKKPTTPENVKMD